MSIPGLFSRTVCRTRARILVAMLSCTIVIVAPCAGWGADADPDAKPALPNIYLDLTPGTSLVEAQNLALLLRQQILDVRLED